MCFSKGSGESEHHVGKIHKGKASYRGHLLRHGWSGRQGELLCLNHVVDRVWKELSGEGANVINMPFSVAWMNFCMSFYQWGERRGGVEVSLSKWAQYPCSESSHYSFNFCLVRAVGIENILIFTEFCDISDMVQLLFTRRTLAVLLAVVL